MTRDELIAKWEQQAKLNHERSVAAWTSGDEIASDVQWAWHACYEVCLADLRELEDAK